MNRPALRATMALLLCLGLAGQAMAETLRVGPGQAFRVPSAAAAVARDGDRVLIAPGRYRDCAIWRAAGLSIEAAGMGAVEISGPICAGKALFVIAGRDASVVGLTFRGAAFPGGNAAGIRAEGGDLRILRSRFLGNQNGILAGGPPEASLVVEDSEFIGNGAHLHACAHGLYAGRLALLAIRRSRFEATVICHHIKSRAARTEVVDSLILDGPEGMASYLLDLPNGGDLLLQGNEMRKGPRSGNPGVAVIVGAEGVTQPTQSLRLLDNRFTNLQPWRTVFLRNLSDTPAELQGNVLRGPVVALEGPGQVR
ncbi:hypothetical protein [Siccirubricoccus sp. G192]|uniref:hypothetical protein n=1 Tax=Siccirubricoccus sp. G192 TaxID=2849651 RepID=UPI001C2BAAFD|nr:hypothetical protein [Siccirubricoccus sp. G192]MBV1799982.1 hypothetical protein [Siccirubricoccus sp. G192]